MAPNVLVISGFDSHNNAGITVDVKVLQHFGCDTICLPSAITIQDHTKVYYISENLDFDNQIQCLFDEYNFITIKLGMLYSKSIINSIVQALTKLNQKPKIVFDSVLASSSGAQLIENFCVCKHIQEALLPHVDIITPNVHEVCLLTNIDITSHQDVYDALHTLHKFGVKTPIIKGGHLNDNNAIDYALINHNVYTFSTRRYNAKNARGTGCRFSSAIAASLTLNKDIIQSISIAKKYVADYIYIDL